MGRKESNKKCFFQVLTTLGQIHCISAFALKLRALKPLLGNGAGALGIGKISGVSTKIGKIYIVYMYVVSIARLIQIVSLTLFLEIIYKISFNN